MSLLKEVATTRFVLSTYPKSLCHQHFLYHNHIHHLYPWNHLSLYLCDRLDLYIQLIHNLVKQLLSRAKQKSSFSSQGLPYWAQKQSIGKVIVPTSNLNVMIWWLTLTTKSVLSIHYSANIMPTPPIKCLFNNCLLKVAKKWATFAKF